MSLFSLCYFSGFGSVVADINVNQANYSFLCLLLHVIFSCTSIIRFMLPCIFVFI